MSQVTALPHVSLSLLVRAPYAMENTLSDAVSKKRSPNDAIVSVKCFPFEV